MRFLQPAHSRGPPVGPIVFGAADTDAAVTPVDSVVVDDACASGMAVVVVG